MTKVILGLSGGVDSSVAALLLLEQGYEVEAAFMKNWEEDDNDEYCSAAKDIADAQQICDKLHIPLHKINFAAEYWDRVFEYFLAEYRAGRTPNPDILCNKEIKFKAFLDYALSLGADFIATGHYARKSQHAGEHQLLKGLDPSKDQSYFLYALNQSQLSKSLFPVGDHHKTDIRKIAAKAGLITHNKKDSTGICFIGERKFKDFLNRYIPSQPGLIKTPEGKMIGEHQGLMYYTIGQRQGLGIGGMKNRDEAPWFVLAKDLKNNVLIAGQGHDHPWLYAKQLSCQNIHWIAEHAPQSFNSLSAKIRYRAQDQACQIEIQDNQVLVTFDAPQWAITPGQSIVFYQGDVCLGGAIITEARGNPGSHHIAAVNPSTGDSTGI